MEENTQKKFRDFVVTLASPKKWAVTSGKIDRRRECLRSTPSLLGPGAAVEDSANYVPSFGVPRLFRWHGHWAEITRIMESQVTPSGKHVTSLQLMSVPNIFCLSPSI